VSYRIDTEVAQKGKQSLPEDGIVLPKYVGAIVKENKEVYNFSAFSWLVSTQYVPVYHTKNLYPH
jgi:hypothetical protein